MFCAVAVFYGRRVETDAEFRHFEIFGQKTRSVRHRYVWNLKSAVYYKVIREQFSTGIKFSVANPVSCGSVESPRI